jgi:SAM-dependent methyltransferase
MLWRLKVLAKILLSRVPLGYTVFRRIGIFRHGAMDSAGYALKVFQAHFGRARERGLTTPFVALEIGPGDSVASAILARSVGASAIWLVDAGNFATDDMRLYVKTVETARAEGLAVPEEVNLTNLSSLLSSCHARYLSTGLRHFSEIPSGSVDFVWSQAVLEHVRSAELGQLVSEMYRVLRPGGIASHRVDLKDHLGGSLNNLRFSDALWESRLMANSGFYTNRLRFGQMLNLFRQAGFAVEVLATDRWPTLPLPRRVMADRFRALPDEELCVRGFDVILCRPVELQGEEVVA